MKAACLLTDSIYALTVSDRGGREKDVLGLGFASVWETAGGDDMTGAGSVGRGGVLEVSIETGSWASGVSIGSVTGAGTSSCALPTLDVLALDPGAGLSPDSADSWLVFRVGDVWRFCNTFVGERSGNSDRFGTFSSGKGCPGRRGSGHRREPSFPPRWFPSWWNNPHICESV